MKNLKLKSARAALDLSQQQLAEKVGVSRQTINAIEKGDYNPTIKLCMRLKKGIITQQSSYVSLFAVHSEKPWTIYSGNRNKILIRNYNDSRQAG